MGILQTSILEWVAVPFSRRSFQPRDRTPVSCIAGRFFTVWATRKPKYSGMGGLSLLQGHLPTQESKRPPMIIKNIVYITIPVLYNTSLQLVCFIHSSLYPLTLPLFPLPFGNHRFVLYICESVSFGHIHSFLLLFRFQLTSWFQISSPQNCEKIFLFD